MSAQATGRIRLIIATLLAPIVAAAIAAIVIGLPMGGADMMTACNEPPYDPCGAPTFGDILQFVGTASVIGGMMGAAIGWPAMLIGGLPAHAYLTRRNQTHFWIYTALGAVIGSVAMIVYFAIVGDLMSLLVGDGGWLTISGPLSGGLAAGLFWFIRRPDRMGLA